MSNPKPAEGAAQPKEEGITLTQSQFAEILLKLSEQSAKSTENVGTAIAEAIKESRKPFKDPNVEANLEMERRNAREIEARKKRETEFAQRNCPHIMGCNPMSEARDPNGRTSIAWHVADTGDTIGICTVCQRLFRETDADYADWYSKPRGNRLSKAGDRKWPHRPYAGN